MSDDEGEPRPDHGESLKLREETVSNDWLLEIGLYVMPSKAVSNNKSNSNICKTVRYSVMID